MQRKEFGDYEYYGSYSKVKGGKFQCGDLKTRRASLSAEKAVIVFSHSGTDVSAVADVVRLTISEFIPRQVIRLQQVLRDFPLI